MWCSKSTNCDMATLSSIALFITNIRTIEGLNFCWKCPSTPWNPSGTPWGMCAFIWKTQFHSVTLLKLLWPELYIPFIFQHHQYHQSHSNHQCHPTSNTIGSWKYGWLFEDKDKAATPNQRCIMQTPWGTNLLIWFTQRALAELFVDPLG